MADGRQHLLLRAHGLQQAHIHLIKGGNCLANIGGAGLGQDRHGFARAKIGRRAGQCRQRAGDIGRNHNPGHGNQGQAEQQNAQQTPLQGKRNTG